MNIFAVDRNPWNASELLPDKLVVKMILESCQMISVVYGPYYHNWSTIPKSDGTPFGNKGFRNHPCTIWVAQSYDNLAWLISHAIGLCHEYTIRYGKVHSLYSTLIYARSVYSQRVGIDPDHNWDNVNSFARAMPDELKNNTTIDDVASYRLYMNTKPWVTSNYIKQPTKKPTWIR